MDKTLVILAAGMGSRYGGLKQIDPVGPDNSIIIDYSIFDAVKNGFNKVVFIIKKDDKEQTEVKAGYDEFGNGYTLDENGDKVFYVSNPYPIKQPVWVSDKEVYFYNIFGQPSLSAELGREIATSAEAREILSLPPRNK